jgi:hypothetical protein
MARWRTTTVSYPKKHGLRTRAKGPRERCVGSIRSLSLAQDKIPTYYRTGEFILSTSITSPRHRQAARSAAETVPQGAAAFPRSSKEMPRKCQENTKKWLNMWSCSFSKPQRHSLPWIDAKMRKQAQVPAYEAVLGRTCDTS